MKVSKIKHNPSNPRHITDEALAKLKVSIEQFPKMMKLRPMVINQDGIVLGGNMRLIALQELGYKEIPDEWVKRAEELTPEEQRRFIIADNVGFGEWDFEMLRGDFDVATLEDWGLEVFIPEDIDLDNFFKEEQNTSEKKEEKHFITLEYTAEDYEKVNAAFKNMEGTKENIVFKLLGL